MIETWEDRCTALSGRVDALSKSGAAPQDQRPGPRSPVGDRAVITVPVGAEVGCLEEEQRVVASRQRHAGSLCPRAPQRARCQRRRRALREGATRRRRLLHAATGDLRTPPDRSWGMRDSLAAPVRGLHHAQERPRWPHKAPSGPGASTKQTLCGVKLHLLIRHGGLLLACALAPAQHAEGAVSAHLLVKNAPWVGRADKGSSTTALPTRLAWRSQAQLLTPRRAPQKEHRSDELTKDIQRLRQSIEPVHRQLVDPFPLQPNRAKSLEGLCARVRAHLTAQTVGVPLHLLLNRPLLALTACDLI